MLNRIMRIWDQTFPPAASAREVTPTSAAHKVSPSGAPEHRLARSTAPAEPSQRSFSYRVMSRMGCLGKVIFMKFSP